MSLYRLEAIEGIGQNLNYYMKTIADLFQESKRPTYKYDTYFDAYEELFAPYKGKDVVFVEVGIQGGGSLEVWKKFFGPKSRIIGIDLNPVLKDELEADGFEIFTGDQSSEDFWKSFFEEVGPVDILLDDGGHTNLQTKTTIKCSLEHINDRGLLIVEDAHQSYMKQFQNPSDDSLIHHTKDIVDLVNSRSMRVKMKFPDPCKMRSQIHSVQYFESIVALKVNRPLSKISEKVNYGSEESLSTNELPEDFRYEGIEEKPKKKGFFSR